jgi:hypothetical protein
MRDPEYEAEQWALAAKWELNREALLAAAVMRKLGVAEVEIFQSELESVDMPEVARSFALSGDTVTIRLSDRDAAEAEPVKPEAGWRSLGTGEKVGVVIAGTVMSVVGAALVVVLIKGLMVLFGWVF